MAIINRFIQQAAGVDNITITELNSNRYHAGLYKLTESLAIYRDKSNPNIYYIGEHTNATLYKEFDHCSIIANSDVRHDPTSPSSYTPTTQIIIPYNDTVDSQITEIFFRYNNESGAWSDLSKIQSGESIRGVQTEEGFYLVNNDDPINPVVLSDRTKMDKILNYTFTEGSNYKPGDIIPTNEPGMNAYVVTVDEFTGGITKIALTKEPVTTTKGKDATVTINTEIEGSIVEFDKFGNPIPSDFKADYVKPYEFTYQDSYVRELDFDEVYDESELAGGSSDYGFAYTPFSFTNFVYKLIDKATGEELEGKVDFDFEKPMYIPAQDPGNLVWYGYVNSTKVLADISSAKNYVDGDTFSFQIGGNSYTGTIVNSAQDPWVLTTTLPVDIGAITTGLCDTTTLTGSGTGLKVWVSPSVVCPCHSINVEDIPDRSLVWSGVKATINESTTKIGTICIPFQFKFDIKVNGEVNHIVEFGTITMTGVYGLRNAWTSSNYNTITPVSDVAENWNNGDKFTLSILGTTYEGQIDDVLTEPFTLHTNIPQTTNVQMTGVYSAIATAPSKGTGLLINVDTVKSFTYKLKNTYVDPHGGVDPAFYDNSQVDVLLARQRIQSGTLNNIVAFAGQEGKFNELVRTESVNKDPEKRSDYSIPTEAAIGDYVESKMDNDTITNLTSEWIQSGEQLNLNKSSGDVASSVLVPYASETQDGLIKKGMYNQINADHTTMLSLQGMVFIGADLGETPISQTTCNDAWAASGKPGPVIGNKIINTSAGNNQGHNWMYLEIDGTTKWYDLGSGNVAVATNSIQGVVMGTEPDSDYDYNSSIVKQSGSAVNFINETLTTTAAGAEAFQVKVMNTDSDGNITKYELTPKTGVDRKMLANIPFTKSHTTALYYNTSYVIDASSAHNYVNQEKFTIDGIPGSYEGYVLNSTLDPILCITNIPSKTNTDISGTYTTTSTTGSGRDLRVIVTSVPYYETVTFRLNITSWENPLDTIEISDIDGHMKASGVGILAEHTKFLNQTKADREEITITSNDNTISIHKPEGFENYPRFDLSFNLAASTVWITLTGLLDGVTSEWDITPYLQGVSTSDLEFYYGDGILFAGIDYMFKTNINVLSGGAGYEVNDIVMLNNDTRSAKVLSVDSTGQILTAALSTSLPSTTSGTGADLAAQFIFTSLKDPVMNSAKNRTFMVKGTKLSLVSDLSGVTDVIDPTGTINTSVKDNVATIGLNVNNVFRANPVQPCYITLTTPSESQGILSQGSLINILQSLTNNMKYVMDNAVWKYKNSDNRVEIAVQDATITQKKDINIIQIRPSDLGQIAEK